VRNGLHATRELGYAQSELGDLGERRTSLRRALTEAVGFGLHSIAACAQSNLGTVLIRSGRLEMR